MCHAKGFLYVNVDGLSATTIKISESYMHELIGAASGKLYLHNVLKKGFDNIMK